MNLSGEEILAELARWRSEIIAALVAANATTEAATDQFWEALRATMEGS